MSGTYLGHLDLVSLLKMFGELFNELLGGNVLNSDSHLLVDDSVGDLK